MTITSAILSLSGDEEMTITASYSGFTNGEIIYLKGVFFKDGQTNYLGYTKKNDTWVKSSATNADQRSITIGQWDGTLVSKPDWRDTGYAGDGGYSAKVGFYYLTGGDLSSVNWSSNNLAVSLTAPTPTPTATLVPSSTPKPTDVPATSVPVPSQTNIPPPVNTAVPTVLTASMSPTKKMTPSLSPTQKMASESSGLQVLGETTDPIPTPESLVPSGRVSYKPLIITMLLVSIGLALIAGVLVWLKRNAGKDEQKYPTE